MKVLALLFLFLSGFAIAQKKSSVYPIEQGAGSETLFVDINGKIVFKLEPGHKPITSAPLLSHMIWDGQQNSNTLLSEIYPVERPDGSFYWIDKKGRILKDFGTKFSSMSPFNGGYCLAWEKIDLEKANSLVFLDKTGNNAFGSKKFYKASPFSEGYAAVQLENEDGEWGYIDQTGNMAIHLNKEIKEKIFKIGLFRDGLALIMTKVEESINHPFTIKYYFIDKAGKIIFDLENIIASEDELFNISNFSEGIAGIRVRTKDKSSKMLLINHTGKIVANYPHCTGFSGFVGGFATLSFSYPQDKRNKIGYKLILTSGEEVAPDMSKVKSRLLNPKGNYGKLYTFNGIDNEGFTTLIFSKADNKLLYETRGELIAVEDDVVLIKYKRSEELKLIRLPNKILWRTPMEDKVFLSIDEALQHKANVRKLSLYPNGEIGDTISELTQLESLFVGYSELKELPKSLGQLRSLRHLNLSNLDNLKVLPGELALLTQLESISISDCPQLKGFEKIIESLPALKEITLENMTTSPDFEAKMRLSHPGIKITNTSFSMDIELDME